MHCDDARMQLFDGLDQAEQDAARAAALQAHLEGCVECRALQRDIHAMQARARVWHELNPPAWNVEPAASLATRSRPPWLALIPQWFPVLASTAALLLAAGLYWRGGPADPGAPAPAAGAGAPETAARAVAPGAEQLLAASRRERREELEALSALLKAEMDRRSLETEQSLKYIIAHQIRSQRQLEAMRGELQPARAVEPTEQL